MTSRADQAIAYLEGLNDQELDDFFKEVMAEVGDAPPEDSDTFFWMMGGAVDYFDSLTSRDTDSMETLYADSGRISISTYATEEAVMSMESDTAYVYSSATTNYMYRFKAHADDLDAA